MPDPCEFKDEIIQIGKDVSSIKTDLKNAIVNTTNHIESSSKWRLTILITCIGLIGTIVSGIVRFSINEYKVTMIQNEQDRMKTQLYDLNFEKGRAVGLAEKDNGQKK